MIRFSCPNCEYRIKSPPEFAGRSARCPQCRETLRIPDADETLDDGMVAQTETPVPQSRAVTVSEQSEPQTAAATSADWSNARATIIDIELVRSELALVNWGLLNPLTHLRHDRPWTLVWVQLLTFAFCVPLGVACNYRETASLEEVAWVLSLYFAVLWAVFLHRCIQPDRIPKRTLLAVWSSTAVLGVLAVIVLTALGALIPGFREIFAASASGNWVWRVVGMTLAVGLIEEGVKALPVLWIAYRQKSNLRAATIIYLGAVSGLAFGATEGMLYSIAYATDHRSNYLSDGAYLVVQVVRFVSLPLLHAVWSGTFGYYIALAASRQPGARAILSIGLIGVALLHGVYNTMAEHWGGFAMATTSLAIFVSYVRRSLVPPLERTPSGRAPAPPETSPADQPQTLPVA